MKKRRSQHFEQEDRILKYLKGQLPDPERENFEDALKSSPTLRKEARFF